MSPTFSPEGPYPLIPITKSAHNFHDYNTLAQWFSTELALTHNVIIRALNSIWLNAPLVVPEDVGDFTGYGLACTSMLRAHHATQEQVVFPLLQERIEMRDNVLQHLAFDAGLRNLETYLRAVHEKTEVYDCDKFLRLRANLGADLIQHLHDEIDTVSPKQMDVFSLQELQNLGHAIDEHKQEFRDSANLFPFMVTNHDRGDATNWPVVSTSAKWIGTHVGFHLHRHYWRFSPYSHSGKFQTYPNHIHDSDKVEVHRSH